MKKAYRFEIGGGHWIFGGDPTILQFISRLTPVKTYFRRSSVYFRQEDRYVPYPLQNFLRYLDPAIAAQALAEMASPQQTVTTMKDWLEQSFGQTLCEKFFYPFHELYTAGLYTKIAPQDAYKSPVNLALAIRGALDNSPAVGYNTTFIYPIEGLNTLAQRMGQQCDIRYGQRVVQIDVDRKILTFADNSCLPYDTLISTLPLNRMIEMTGLSIDEVCDPYTSVLVLNLGAVRGDRCPDDHWLYNPDAKSGFHRVGFYSNVDRSFLPQSARETGDRVSIYVERAYVGGVKPTENQINAYVQAVVQELQEWGYIKTVEVVDPTWIDVAYTWALPGSSWRNKAMKTLENHNIYPIGRYARWIFQGISDSIKDGFFVGSSFK
ncbi:protoporphyrinogen/coproporphyrinogen oxidase [Aphanothece sacrum]|uniref:protoporphyrinogen/coproporphyrinogen oxidase n=1 Tax=Aphanothece sacrum TaxID=1122 RepID=UPI000FF9C886|nr:FAD-dependent oxidoreductase [Aphanothece sacrum]GBF86581.1 O-antigen synthesis protein WbyH [Aphanothece sacrum FPU3]